MYRGRRGKPKDPPTVAIKKARELLEKKKQENAFNVLFETISYRHRAQFDPTFEEAMKLYIDVGVSILKSCKEGFLHYRSLVQQNHPQSLQKMIRYLVSSVEAAGETEIASFDAIDSELQYESKTLKYEWESFQTVLMILRNNGKLNHVYMEIVVKGINFCKTLKRSKEFKKLNETIRRRFGYVINNQSFDYALKINALETLNSMFETRLHILQCALDMALHQESFKTIKDIQKNIVYRSYELKKNINPQLFSSFYQKLSVVFWQSNRFLLHSYAIFESYKKLKQFINSKIAKKNRISYQTEHLYPILKESLISILIVNDNSKNNPEKTRKNNYNYNYNNNYSNNKHYTHSLYQLANDFFAHNSPNKQILANKHSLLNIIIKEIQSYKHGNGPKREKKEKKEKKDEKKEKGKDPFVNVKDLYNLIIVNKFSPLTFTLSLSSIMRALKMENLNILYYGNKVHEMAVIVLLKQLSLCYKSISWQRFKQLIAPFGADLSDIELQQIITFSIYYGHTICCQLSHSKNEILFINNDNNLECDLFVNSIIELNNCLLPLVANNTNNTNRNNVFNQIRFSIISEHDRISKRLLTIRHRQRRGIEIKRRQERVLALKKEKEEEIKKVIQQSEIKKVQKVTNIHIKNQQNKEEKKKNFIKAQKKWNEILGNSLNNTSSSAVKQNVKNVKNIKNAKNKQKKTGSAALREIEKRENLLAHEIAKEIERKDGNFEDTRDKMAKLEKMQKKKQKKRLQEDKILYDHFCRAKRKYLIRDCIEKEITKINDSNLKERKILFKRQQKENKEKYLKKIKMRHRLRDIKYNHIKKFISNVAASKQSKKTKKKNINKDSKRPKVKQLKETKPAKQTKAKQKEKAKPKPKPKEKPKEKEKAKAKAVVNKNNENNKKPKTFAEKMKAKRGGDASQPSQSMAFGDKFGRNMSFSSQSQAPYRSSRFGQRMNDNNYMDNNKNSNNNNDTNIRPNKN